MNAKQHIEEIARTICGNYDREENKCLCDLENGICDLDCWAGRHPAEALYQSGYRKQSEGEWTVSHCDLVNLYGIKCSCCQEEWFFEEEGDVVAMHYHYCPNCGAHMRGDNNEKE